MDKQVAPNYTPLAKQALEQIVLNTEKMHAKSVWRVFFIVNVHQERFVNWILAAVGAGLALTIANLREVVSVIGPAAMQWVLALSGITIVLGVLVKHYALMIRELVAMQRVMEKYIGPEKQAAQGHYQGVLETAKAHGIEVPPAELPKIDYVRLADKILSPVPNWVPDFFKERFKRAFLSGVADPLQTNRNVVRALIIQKICVAVMLILLIAIIGTIAGNISA